jgi:hypothetical protein
MVNLSCAAQLAAQPFSNGVSEMTEYTRTDNVEYHDGYNAFGRGDRSVDCPYSSSSDRSIDSRWNRWHLGWEDAMRQTMWAQSADQY